MTRRTFGKLCAAAGIVSAAGRLRLGVGCYTYHSLSIDDMIAQLKTLDIREIEMSRVEFMNFTKPPVERFETFRRKIDAAGIKCVSYYAPTIKEKSDLETAIHFARLLGAKNITGDPTGSELLKHIDQKMTAEGMSFG